MELKVKTQPLLERNLELVLIGAAKVLGCNSASLLFIDEERKNIRLHVATYSDQISGLEQAREILGFEPRDAIVPIDLVGDSIILKSYREKKILETGRISDLVGSKMVPDEAVNILESLIREIRFSCVPVVGSTGVEAIILFSKMNDRPFTFQQRRLQLEYASRLGLIIESEKFSEQMVAIREKLLTGSNFLPQSVKEVLSFKTEAMLTLDDAQTIMAVNARAEEMFSAKGKELVGSPFEVLFDEEEAASKVLECRLKLLSDGHMEVKARMKRLDGDMLYAQVSGVLAVDGEGKGAGAIIRIKELLEESRDSQLDPHERLHKSERLAMIGEMASQMAHEIRNPLVSIGAALRVIREDLPDNAPVRDELMTILNEVDRLDSIIRDYLTLAKRSVGRVERVRIGDVLGEAAKMVSINPACDGIDIKTSVGKSCDVLGDFDALKQVFINLLINAVEESLPGGEVECTAYRIDQEVIVKVLDRGDGPADKPAEKLFEPFYTTKSKGSGLGLSISKNIIEELGGEISLHEREGGGCEVVVRLRAML